jgi:hypothetical protein
MPNEPTPDAPLRDFGDMERDVVYLLTEPTRCPTLWSVADVGREIEYGDPDALVRPLVHAGLLHRIADDYVFATPAAFHLTSLVGHVV